MIGGKQSPVPGEARPDTGPQGEGNSLSFLRYCHHDGRGVLLTAGARLAGVRIGHLADARLVELLHHVDRVAVLASNRDDDWAG